jgi:hypothetical protein
LPSTEVIGKDGGKLPLGDDVVQGKVLLTAVKILDLAFFDVGGAHQQARNRIPIRKAGKIDQFR